MHTESLPSFVLFLLLSTSDLNSDIFPFVCAVCCSSDDNSICAVFSFVWRMASSSVAIAVAASVVVEALSSITSSFSSPTIVHPGSVSSSFMCDSVNSSKICSSSSKLELLLDVSLFSRTGSSLVPKEFGSGETFAVKLSIMRLYSLIVSSKSLAFLSISSLSDWSLDNSFSSSSIWHTSSSLFSCMLKLSVLFWVFFLLSSECCWNNNTRPPWVPTTINTLSLQPWHTWTVVTESSYPSCLASYRPSTNANGPSNATLSVFKLPSGVTSLDS